MHLCVWGEGGGGRGGVETQLDLETFVNIVFNLGMQGCRGGGLKEVTGFCLATCIMRIALLQ